MVVLTGEGALRFGGALKMPVGPAAIFDGAMPADAGDRAVGMMLLFGPVVGNVAGGLNELFGFEGRNREPAELEFGGDLGPVGGVAEATDSGVSSKRAVIASN